MNGRFEFEPDTPEFEVFVAAIEVAAWAPLEQPANTVTVAVPWKLIDQLRDRLDDCDVDWRSAAGSSHTNVVVQRRCE